MEIACISRRRPVIETRLHMRAWLWLVPLLSTACSTEEAPRASMPVAIDASSASRPALTDLGYTVALSRARAALRDLQFTVGGETHTALLDRIGRWILPLAHAHPGHSAGGEVVGELPGPLLVDWLEDGAAMGTAVLIATRYQGANFGFRAATAAELPAGDPLVGHTFAFEGTASRDGRTVAFTALVDVDSEAVLVGAPFDDELAAGATGTLKLRLLPGDAADGAATIWNQIDFHALPGAAAGAATIRTPEEAHNRLVRALRIHDHYDVTHD
jgi:hypothetical protein